MNLNVKRDVFTKLFFVGNSHLLMRLKTVSFNKKWKSSLTVQCSSNLQLFDFILFYFLFALKYALDCIYYNADVPPEISQKLDISCHVFFSVDFESFSMYWLHCEL